MVRECFEYGPILVWALMLLTVVLPLRPGRRLGVALAAALLVASQKFLIFKFLGGDSFKPELPWAFVTFEGWAYSSVMILFALSVAWLVCLGTVWLAKRFGCARVLRRVIGRPAGKAFDCARVSRRVIPALAVCAMSVAGWGVWEGVRIPPVRRVCVKVPNLPKEAETLRFIHLTDLHCCAAARRSRMAKIVDRVRAQRPEFVCITGDLVDGSPANRSWDVEPLKDLAARCPVYMCAGNHEYYSDYSAWRPVFESCGLTMLDNAHVVFEGRGGKVVVGGVTDMVAKRYGLETPNAKKAFAGAPKDAFKILLQHRPHRPWENAKLGVDLQLSGHTHGGAILGLDRIVADMGNYGFVRGLYRVGELTLYVNSGTGQWAGFPLRLGVPAEITEIVLERE